MGIKYKMINSPDQIKTPLIFSANYKCKGSGFFYNGQYGYYGCNSHLKNFYQRIKNKTLNSLGLMAEWRCDGSGKSRIVRKKL